MASIYDVGTSALTSMQRAIATTGHNIANVNTEGYSRQEVLLGTRSPEKVGQVEIGTGVEVSNIRRAHDSFLMRDVQTRSGSNGYFQLYAETAQSVDGLLADPSTGIAPAMNKFFAAMEAVAANPSSAPERQVLLSEAQMLTQRFNYVDTRLSEFAGQLNTRMANMTDDINALATDIAQLNESIVALNTESRGAPNDLLDRRDQAITDLSKLIGVQTTKQDNGAINVMIGKGQRLVIGNSAEQLRMTLPAAQDGPSRLYLSVPSGAESEVTSKLTGGELGGALDAGAKLINKARREVGLLAIGITETFNRQHSQGSDLNGDQGEAFFQNLDAAVTGSRDNSGLVAVTANITQEQNLTGDGYSLRYEEAGIRLTNLSSGDSQLVDAGVLELPGLSITIPQQEADGVVGDMFFIEPTLGAASSMTVALTDPSKIAAANQGSAVGDNRNMLSLIELRDVKTLKDGAQSYTSLYGSTLSSVAVETRSAISNAETEQSLLRSAEDRLDGLRGVNLDEEATNLIRYQQAYQAAAQVISVANDIFDTLLMASRR
jgi:flagellar hook-associated protein 1 FlgK